MIQEKRKSYWPQPPNNTQKWTFHMLNRSLWMILINHYSTLITDRFLLSSVGIKIQTTSVSLTCRCRNKGWNQEEIERIHLWPQLWDTADASPTPKDVDREQKPFIHRSETEREPHAHTELNAMVQVDHMKVILFTTESSCKCPTIKASVSNTAQLFAEMLLISSKSQKCYF